MAPLSNFIPSTFTGHPSSSPPPTIASVSSPSSPPPVGDECLSCRIIGGTTFAGLGGYAMYESIQQGALVKGAEPKRRVLVLGVFGAVMAVLGVGRLAGLRAPGAGGGGNEGGGLKLEKEVGTQVSIQTNKHALA